MTQADLFPARKMHSARLKNSERLQRAYGVMRDGRPRTTLEIIQAAQVCAVNSVISELRDNGCAIDCWRNGDVWLYRMTRDADGRPCGTRAA